MKSLLLTARVIVFLLIASACFSQKTARKKTTVDNDAAGYAPQLYSGMKWRNIGPYQGGRSLTATGVTGDPLTYYFGATGGGVWKTIDGGISWFAVSDTAFHSSSVGAIAVAPSDPNVIYAGMGEAAIRNTAIMGDGIYKSTDAGKTWKHQLTLDASAIGQIIIHPKNPEVAYAAVMGKIYGANKERGVYRTKDGGKSWQQILAKDDSTGAIDIDFDPSNPSIIYASLWQAHRMPWKLSSGGPGCGLYKTTDGGDTWTLLSKNPGMPKGLIGKICIAVSASNPQRVYAMVESEHSRLFRSDNGGATWDTASAKNDLTQRPWYFSEIFCDPKNKDVVYVCNVELWKSIDGGMSFSKMEQEHGDNHAMWINPDNPENFILADDGSVAVTFNGGRTWTDEDIPTCQFYHVNLDNDFPYHAYGGQQDWGSVRIATRSYGSSIGAKDWYVPAGGEAGYIVPDPMDPSVSYGGEYDGILSMHDKKNEQYKYVSVYPEINDGYGSGVNKYRFHWTFPISFSPWDPKLLYCTSQMVHRSINGGMSWETISPDLTRNDVTKQQQSGGPITPDNTGAEVFGDIFAFAESPVKQGLLWAGSDDGLVHVSTDNGASWNNVTPANLPEWTTVSIIEPSHFDAATCYIAAHRYRLNDVHPYIFRTTDYGKTWTLITGGLKENVYTRCVREDPNRKGLLYAGTETGVSVSFDNGDHWQSLQMNLPVTPVHDLQVKKDLQELVIATHGRGFWVLDDVTPLYQINDSIADAQQWLYQPRVAIRMDGNQITEEKAAAIYLQEGTNAPNGVIVNYYFRQRPKGEIRLVFYNAAGDSIIAFSNKHDKHGNKLKGDEKFYKGPQKDPEILTADSGMNRFVWDMNYPHTRLFDEDWWYNDALAGPKAMPGNYSVKLMQGDTMLMQRKFSIVLNPKVNATQADLQAQFDLMMQVNKEMNAIATGIIKIRSVRDQVNAFTNSFRDTTKIKSLKAVAKPLLDSLEEIEDTLIQVKAIAGEDVLRFPMQMLERMCALQDFIRAADSRPPMQQFEVANVLIARSDSYLKRLDNIFMKQVTAFNAEVMRLNLPVVDPVRSLK
ncbi:MAG: hypothetical protein K1X61_03330 [Chitinophagales bacterium]|nr:hypothetical protein [Chitinophagales bacterium]